MHQHVTWRDKATTAEQQLATVTAERDEANGELYSLADFIERHWRGAGLPLKAEWMITRISKWTDELETLTRQLEEARGALIRLLSLCEQGGDPFEEPNHAVVQQARAALSPEAKP